MKKYNFIALLGFVLVISPHAFGQEKQAILAKMAVEKEVKMPILTQKSVKKFPFQKQRVLLKTSTFRFRPVFCIHAPFFLKNLTHVERDVSRFSPPKILEEENFSNC